MAAANNATKQMAKSDAVSKEEQIANNYAPSPAIVEHSNAKAHQAVSSPAGDLAGPIVRVTWFHSFIVEAVAHVFSSNLLGGWHTSMKGVDKGWLVRTAISVSTYL